MCVWGIGLSGFCVWFGCYMHLRCPCFILGPGSILLECLWSPCRKFVAMTIIIIIPWRSSLCHMILIIMSNDDYHNIIHEDDFPTREQFNFPTRMQNNFLTKVQENFPTKMQRNFPTRMYITMHPFEQILHSIWKYSRRFLQRFPLSIWTSNFLANPEDYWIQKRSTGWEKYISIDTLVDRKVEMITDTDAKHQLLLLLRRLLLRLLHRAFRRWTGCGWGGLLLLLGATLLDPGVCIEEPILVCRLGVGVQGPHLGRVLLLGGHVQLHCVAVLGREK